MLVEPIPKFNMYRLERNEVLFHNKIKYTMNFGFVCDGASIPKPFWSVVTSPFHPKIIRGAFWHDWFYRTHYIVKGSADLLFRRLIIVDGFDPTLAEICYQAVKKAGASAWDAGPAKPLVGIWS